MKVPFLAILALAGTGWSTEGDLTSSQSSVDKALREEISRLVRQLGNSEFKVREEAFQTLFDRALIDPDKILGMLPKEDSNPEIREACSRIREAVPKEPAKRQMMKAVGSAPEGREMVERLFSHPDPDLLIAVASQATDRKAMAEGIAWFLKNEDSKVRSSVSEALRILREKNTVPEWVKLLDDPDPEIRIAAVVALGGRLRDKSAAPELVKMLGDPVQRVRSVAVDALGWLGKKSAAPELVKMLGDPDPGMRVGAITALSNLKDKSAAPELVKLLADPDPRVRHFAVDALGSLGEKSVAPEVAKILKDSDPDMRGRAACALAVLGGKSFLPELLGLLEDPDPQTRALAAVALWRLGEKSAVSELARRLEDSDQNVRFSAAQVIEKLSGGHWLAGKEGEDQVQTAIDWWKNHGTESRWRPREEAKSGENK